MENSKAQVFKERLKGTRLFLDEKEKTIYPLVEYIVQNEFYADLAEFLRKEENTRGKITLEHYDPSVGYPVPVFDSVDSFAFYLYNNWKIHEDYIQNMKFGGWTEMDRLRAPLKYYTQLIVALEYSDQEILPTEVCMKRSNGSIDKHLVPMYNNVRYNIETGDVRRLWLEQNSREIANTGDVSRMTGGGRAIIIRIANGWARFI